MIPGGKVERKDFSFLRLRMTVLSTKKQFHPGVLHMTIPPKKKIRFEEWKS